jgi:hypothetical protein
MLSGVALVGASHAGVVRVKVSSSSEARGYEAYRALDGDKSTLWHTEWRGSRPRHPHDLTIDLGKP